MTGDPATAPLISAVRTLRTAVAESALPLPTLGVETSRTERTELLNQLDDYVLPRLSSLDAPLLCVVGGSTGAGKSTLVNSIVGELVTRAGVLRPTTRASVLIHHPDDAEWFAGQRVLPGLARLTGAATPEDDPGQLRLVASPHMPPGLALLDAPDIDSVVEANRDLARQLLSAADLWMFVTTAVRYADAVPWSLLQQATERGTSVAVVLNRVPMDAVEEVRADLADMLMRQGLGQSPVFAVLESPLDEGFLPLSEVTRLRSWLSSLAADVRARSIIIRRTLDGALDSLTRRTNELSAAVEAQSTATTRLQTIGSTQFQQARDSIEAGMKDGSLLRGEVLARWQDFVGTGEWFRQLDEGVGRLRDRITAFARGRGRPEPVEHLGEALHTGVAALIASNAESAVIGTARQWGQEPAGAHLLKAHRDLGNLTPQFHEQVNRLVRDWQAEVLELVRSEAGGRRTTARMLAFGINGVAVMLMLLAFSATHGLIGAEIGIAGGSALVAQRVLEAVFGDQAVRTLAAMAQQRLLTRVEDLLAAERARFVDVVAATGISEHSSAHLREAIEAVKKVR